MNPTLVIHFSHLRAYHLARLHAAEQACGGMFASIQGIALYDHTGDIPADAEIARPAFPPEVLLPGVSGGNPRRAVRQALDRLRPSAIAICGYATPDARECLRWARRNGARAILMTETRECDAPRVWWKEWIKSRLIRRFHGGLCGGPAARAYLEKLGMPTDRIEEGYDVVDDAYFSAQAEKYRCFGASEAGVSAREIPRYFLASNRFIERKNVAGLIEAYAAYVKSDQGSGDRDQETANAQSTSSNQQSTNRPKACRPIGQARRAVPCKGEDPGGGSESINNQQSSIWPLVLLGDGELKPALIAQCHALGLQVIEKAPWENSSFNIQHSTSNIVYFPGFRQIGELPRFYANAGAFVHPAFIEPWGLVVNEAMACSLPCIVTPGTGAAEVLIRHGQTGWLCDSAQPDALTSAMAEIAAMAASRRHDLGHAARLHLERAAPCSHFGRSLAALLSPSS